MSPRVLIMHAILTACFTGSVTARSGTAGNRAVSGMEMSNEQLVNLRTVEAHKEVESESTTCPQISG